jgi:hypothetical protein
MNRTAEAEGLVPFSLTRLDNEDGYLPGRVNPISKETKISTGRDFGSIANKPDPQPPPTESVRSIFNGNGLTNGASQKNGMGLTQGEGLVNGFGLTSWKGLSNRSESSTIAHTIDISHSNCNVHEARGLSVKIDLVNGFRTNPQEDHKRKRSVGVTRKRRKRAALKALKEKSERPLPGSQNAGDSSGCANGPGVG